MLIEKNLSVATTAIGLAVAGPDALAILQEQRHEVGIGMLIGGLIGALGVFLGATVANSYSERRVRALLMAVWGLTALLMTVTVSLGATVGGNIVLRGALVIVGVLPVFSVAFVAIVQWRSRV
jgi:hypothetical protein